MNNADASPPRSARMRHGCRSRRQSVRDLEHTPSTDACRRSDHPERGSILTSDKQHGRSASVCQQIRAGRYTEPRCSSTTADRKLTQMQVRPKVAHMGFLSRLFIPRGLRRAMHPTRAVRRALTPKIVKRARRGMNPLDNAAYGITRSLNTKRRGGGRVRTYRHGSCPVKHRTEAAALKCRNP